MNLPAKLEAVVVELPQMGASQTTVRSPMKATVSLLHTWVARSCMESPSLPYAQRRGRELFRLLICGVSSFWRDPHGQGKKAGEEERRQDTEP